LTGARPAGSRGLDLIEIKAGARRIGQKKRPGDFACGGRAFFHSELRPRSLILWIAAACVESSAVDHPPFSQGSGSPPQAAKLELGSRYA
jgi:hypothetical protein